MTKSPTAYSLPPEVAWHATSAEQSLVLARTGLAGLSVGESEERLRRLGPNELAETGRLPLLKLVVRQFKSPLIYLFLVAAIVSLALGERVDAAFIAVVLLLNAAIGSFQEYRAETSMSALRTLIQQTARVRRNGLVGKVRARELVVGDVVELESGMADPADLRLLSTSALLADDSTFNGESLPVAKDHASSEKRGERGGVAAPGPISLRSRRDADHAMDRR